MSLNGHERFYISSLKKLEWCHFENIVVCICLFAHFRSEGGVGWRYACALAANHDVWILTDECRRRELELSKHLIPARMHVVYYRPAWLAKLPMNSATAYLIFHFWMASVWRLAAELDAKHDFDICWQLTYGLSGRPVRCGALANRWLLVRLAVAKQHP
jgi:hypothetical protein